MRLSVLPALLGLLLGVMPRVLAGAGPLDVGGASQRRTLLVSHSFQGGSS
jgi:hypothetical protein